MDGVRVSRERFWLFREYLPMENLTRPYGAINGQFGKERDMDYRKEIIRMVTEMTDEGALMRIFHFILYKYRKFKGF